MTNGLRVRIDIRQALSHTLSNFITEGYGAPKINRIRDLQKRGRRRFIISRGYIGLEPKTVTADDKIYLILSTEIPIALGGEKSDLTLIRECYVHG